MSKTIGFSVTLTANQNLRQIAQVNDHAENPVKRDTRVRLFCAESIAGAEISLKLGDVEHVDFVEPAISAAVSTRDHYMGEGVALAGEKITVPLRSTGPLPTVNGRLFLDPV